MPRRVHGILLEGLTAEVIVVFGEEELSAPVVSSSVSDPTALEIPMSGLMNQRLSPRFTSLLESYWPRGADT